VHEVVRVEYYLPGCPPPADRIKKLVVQLLTGTGVKQEGTELKFG
jgi:NAD-reducing hydrogenase small subunit